MLAVAIEIKESPVVIVVAEAANDVPDTVTFPEKTTLPDIVCPLSASDFSSDTDTEFAAKWSAVIKPSATIPAALIALSATFAAVTESSANLAVVTLAFNIFAVITASLAMSPATIVPSVMWSEAITPEGSFAAVIALSAIFAVVT